MSECESIATKLILDGSKQQRPSLLEKCGIEWISSLFCGLVPYAISLDHDDNSMKLNFPSGIIGEIATRSRLGMGWRVDENLILTKSWEKTHLRLNIQGLSIEPIEGAELAFDRLRLHWFENGILDKSLQLPEPSRNNDLLESAWNWWKKEGYTLLLGTKYWRVVESLVGHQVVRATASNSDLALVIVGSACGCSWYISGIQFFQSPQETPHRRARSILGSPRESSLSSEGSTIYAALEYEPNFFRSTLDTKNNNELYEQHQFKAALAERILKTSYASTVTIRLCRKFATSAFNFSLAWYDLSCYALPRADPTLLIKLFQAVDAKGIGGASNTDRALRGALYWQKDDPTYRMTGMHGRVLWRFAASTLASPSASSFSSSSSNLELIKQQHPFTSHDDVFEETEQNDTNSFRNTSVSTFQKKQDSTQPNKNTTIHLAKEPAEPSIMPNESNPKTSSSSDGRERDSTWIDHFPYIIPVCI
eukprot:CAMPEP_0197307240 /NCGR_PEP_ID=MMETSP0891-20130614/4794_1 /TAXON_ID=44058 ORGANISM="Aureoumbra lagunensis, Strain CCMP1510" /NCGR_SAMPLE_ID=MMETSP0891 /ASSEMBLY_ACC=CAM_ASM_000534 /LENGTH=477 /DNA_ID=CAMNT_0042790401 /DNA_START=250 /DNA_END=1683 /DNA_ORIENTATION=-